MLKFSALCFFTLAACSTGEQPSPSGKVPGAETTGVQQSLLQGPSPISVMAQFTAGDTTIPLTVAETVVNFPRMFALDETEVTEIQYSDCVSAGACTAPGTDTDCNWQVSGRDSHPINCVDYLQAVSYCSWAGKRLPTRHEWEFAARFPDGRAYPWGNSNSGYATKTNSNSGDSYTTTSPVGSFPDGDSALGLKDMSGNIYEMTQSPLCPYETGPCTNCPTDEVCDNPCDVCTYSGRTIKGGSYYHAVGETRSAWATTTDLTAQSPLVGFRCAVTIR